MCVHECTSSVVVTEGAPILRSTNPEGAPTKHHSLCAYVHVCECVYASVHARAYVCARAHIMCIFLSLCARAHICICAPAKGFQCACACSLASLHERA